MLKRQEWEDLARKLDWELSYADESAAFPRAVAGRPWLDGAQWRGWDEPFRTTYAGYVGGQAEKDQAVLAVMRAVGETGATRLPREWRSAMKLHGATLPLAEFAAVIGNLRAARFGRDSAWRHAALYGALDELRHAQIPLTVMHQLVKTDPQFDWVHKLYHTDNWVAIAARHLADELLLVSDPIEFAIATNFVFETGFTNLQFVGFSALAHAAGDHLFEKMLQSIQTDEARHAQIGPAVLQVVAAHDKAYAQQLVDKWFWRSWHLFAVVTGFCMDYLTPLEHRTASFKEFVGEWVVDQYLESLAAYGLSRPWYWDEFLRSLDNYHHMVYAAAYSYRSTVWFDMVVPGPAERAWLRAKYPDSWSAYDPIWERVTDKWRHSDPGLDFAVHSTAIPSFCDLCQIVLCEGTPAKNEARTRVHSGKKLIFCSAPCEAIYVAEAERYLGHDEVVKRVLAGVAPGNVMEMMTKYFGLDWDSWGKDAHQGRYPWLERERREL
jgi:toluene monooxygenase system protein A